MFYFVSIKLKLPAHNTKVARQKTETAFFVCFYYGPSVPRFSPPGFISVFHNSCGNQGFLQAEK